MQNCISLHTGVQLLIATASEPSFILAITNKDFEAVTIITKIQAHSHTATEVERVRVFDQHPRKECSKFEKSDLKFGDFLDNE